VLEVGTGLGYQTAILARLVAHVWTVEIVEEVYEDKLGRPPPARLMAALSILLLLPILLRRGVLPASPGVRRPSLTRGRQQATLNPNEGGNEPIQRSRRWASHWRRWRDAIARR
jgi:hypothetical protein